MNDPLRSGFDALPYRHGAIRHTHPARVGAIARLLGLPAAPPERCRVLELGCAEGMNLLPLAERFPHSRFIGMDFSPAHIRSAEEARAACGLANARFECADLREFEPERESFDYVIAHGVYSWVPDEVKDRLLAVCARALAPGGVAYVSYSTLPGWSVLAGLRAFLLTELNRDDDPAAQVGHIGRVLTALGQSLADQPGGYAAAMREAVAELQQKPPSLLFHDDLEIVNDPCTFTHFTGHAARHGLHYLGEAHYASMPFEHVLPAKRATLDGFALDFFREQQFMDVMFQRWMRNSLLTRTAPPSRTLDPAAIDECAAGLRARLVSTQVNLQPGVPLQLRGPHDTTFAYAASAEKALLAALAEAAPARLPFAAAVERANEFLAQVHLPAIDDPAALRHLLTRLYTLDALDLVLTGDGAWLHTAEPAAPSALMRYQASREWSVTNRWHEPIALTGGGARSLTDPAYPLNDAALREAGLLA